MKIYLTSIMVLCLLSIAAVQANEIDVSSKIPIENAILEAKRYVEESNINLDTKFIINVSYYSNILKKHKAPYWSIRWAETTLSKGGGFELRLYEDGTVEEFRYK